MDIEEMITAFHTCRQIKSYLFTGEKNTATILLS